MCPKRYIFTYLWILIRQALGAVKYGNMDWCCEAVFCSENADTCVRLVTVRSAVSPTQMDYSHRLMRSSIDFCAQRTLGIAREGWRGGGVGIQDSTNPLTQNPKVQRC
jgi:hypothetical protein